MLLSSPNEVREYIGETLLDALLQPAVAEALGGRPACMRLGLVDPDCVFVIDAARHEVVVGPGTREALSGFVAMSGDTAIRYCQGKLDLGQALATGEIIAEGECALIMDVLAASSNLRDIYSARLARIGRADLVHEVPLAG